MKRDTEFNFDKMPGGPRDDAAELIIAAFPDDGERRLVTNWLQGIEAAFEIDSTFVLEDGKIVRIGLVYPMHVLSMLADKTLGPAGECLDRLEARGFMVRPVEFKGQSQVIAAIPLDEALRQAKVWLDCDCDEARDCPSITAIGQTKQGFVSGSVEML